MGLHPSGSLVSVFIVYCWWIDNSHSSIIENDVVDDGDVDRHHMERLEWLTKRWQHDDRWQWPQHWSAKDGATPKRKFWMKVMMTWRTTTDGLATNRIFEISEYFHWILALKSKTSLILLCDASCLLAWLERHRSIFLLNVNHVFKHRSILGQDKFLNLIGHHCCQNL